jgi:hypothetical protein
MAACYGGSQLCVHICLQWEGDVTGGEVNAATAVLGATVGEHRRRNVVNGGTPRELIVIYSYLKSG